MEKRIKNKSPYTGPVIIDEFNPPILVYQMGKVGSKTVAISLHQSDIEYNVYHLHALSLRQIENKLKAFKDTPKFIREDIELYIDIRNILLKDTKIKWKIITLSRDIISQCISSFFENIKFRYPELCENNNYKLPYIVKELFEKCLLNKNYIKYLQEWFNFEFKETTGIDIYEYPYNHEKGYTIIKKDNFEVLIMRMEDLNRSFQPAINEFLGYDNISLINKNESKNKDYAFIYKLISESLTLPREYCEDLYSCQYMKHFNRTNEIGTFINQWSDFENDNMDISERTLYILQRIYEKLDIKIKELENRNNEITDLLNIKITKQTEEFNQSIEEKDKIIDSLNIKVSQQTEDFNQNLEEKDKIIDSLNIKVSQQAEEFNQSIEEKGKIIDSLNIKISQQTEEFNQSIEEKDKIIETLINKITKQTKEFNQSIEEKDKIIETLINKITKQTKEFNQSIEEKDKIIENLNFLITEQNKEINKQIDEKEKIIENINNQIKEHNYNIALLNQQLNRFYNSKTYKIVRKFGVYKD
jgi:hypothetical protein